jgi:hypothetical protein
MAPDALPGSGQPQPQTVMAATTASTIEMSNIA